MPELPDPAMPFAQELVRPLRFPVVARLLGKVLTWSYRLKGQHRYDDFRMERVHGLPFVVTPSVFNPKLPRSGAFLASRIDSSLVGERSEVLDMGTGSGVCAVFAARHARRVVAVDINPAAIRCAGINACLNHVERKIELRQGDLFAPVAAERFDLVLFNPPFVQAAPRDDRDRAWRSTDVAARFAAGLRAHLKPAGAALVVLSTFGDAAIFLQELRRQAFEMSILAERQFVNERLVIVRLEPMSRERRA